MGNNDLQNVLSIKKLEQINVDDGLIEYADALESIDENNPLSELNAVSISDNNGGRIYL